MVSELFLDPKSCRPMHPVIDPKLDLTRRLKEHGIEAVRMKNGEKETVRNKKNTAE
jgi:hypothetical protein